MPLVFEGTGTLFDFDDDTGGLTDFSSGTGARTVSATDNSVTFTLSSAGNGINSYFLSYSDGDDNLNAGQFANSNATFVFTFAPGVTQHMRDPEIFITNLSGSSGPATPPTLSVHAVTTLGASVNTQLIAANGTFAFSGNVSRIVFTMSNVGTFTIDQLLTTIVCFCEGTAIETSRGDTCPVESLQVGDVLRTADGGTTTVRWIGKREVDTRLTLPAKVNPICISAGALGNTRDLFVSPDHALLVDGCLVNAAALVNGDTIYQVAKMPREGFTYYHIETDAHELILAEGIAAETYLPQRQELSFDNETSRPQRQIAEMDLPRITSERLLPSNMRPVRAA